MPPRPEAPSAFADDKDHTRREDIVARALERTALDASARAPDVDPELRVFAAINAAAALLARQARLSQRDDDVTTDDDSDREP